ncbi:hypothetical protein B9Z55_007105 [Caenorhabditis nigoni]|uniref:BTB domain-containing protein n=1 Tax=Caenorhabditis nigoni TaxID=1611254 RepID=A0A2G5V835_9PELO|nr:hypothetical protein B9Z55_007105 [Caenorhabditis nigoni]
MSEDQESFVMKHVFDNFTMLESNEKTSFCGETEKHFGVPWRIRISRERSMFKVFLECLRFCGKKTWRINSEIKWKIPKKDGKLFEKTENYVLENDSFPGCCSLRFLYENAKEEYMIDGKFEIEVQVFIIGTIGIAHSILRNFDDDVAKEFSDVVLVAENQKFYVNKMYLALHSTYFKTMFSVKSEESMENSESSEKSEIELKDVDAYDLQKFLEVLYGEIEALNDDTVEEILNLADMFESKTARTNCLKFLIKTSDRSLKMKFEIALKHKLSKLSSLCISEMSTVTELRSVFPEDPKMYEPELWAELYKRLLDLTR